jgi:hypothetical protein
MFVKKPVNRISTGTLSPGMLAEAADKKSVALTKNIILQILIKQKYYFFNIIVARKSASCQYSPCFAIIFF